MVITIQKIDSLFLLAVSLYLYYMLHLNWGLFAFLILAPDIFMLGYLKNPKFGARLYNIGHGYFMPVIMLALYQFGKFEWALPVAIIWFAHIALDRALGFGLKRESGFKDTHLSITA